jgi:hypothetical protein
MHVSSCWGHAGFFDTVGRFDRAWQTDRVICNGCQHPDEWQGPAADLRLALRRVLQDGIRPVLVLDANLFFWPRFNFQARDKCLEFLEHGCNPKYFVGVFVFESSSSIAVDSIC